MNTHQGNYNTYIGARYVPIFDGQWDNNKKYEPLTIVMHEGNSYTSKTYVPIGVDISNQNYWALTGNYNAQLEDVYKQINTISNRINEFESIYFIEDIKDFESFVNKTNPILLIINNGVENIIPNVIFNDNITFLFINGYLSGEFTINGNIIAQRNKIFSVTSIPHINISKNSEGYPEWFGAFPNDTNIDCYNGLMKCIETFNVINFNVGNYYISNTLTITKSFITLNGKQVSADFDDSNINSTRIIITDNSKDCILLNGGDNSDITQIYINNIVLMNKTPDYTKVTNGLKMLNVRGINLNYVYAINFRNGFYVDGVMLSYFNYCRYLTNKTPDTEGVDNQTVGFFIGQMGNTGSNISPTASLYIENCDIHFTSPRPQDYGILSTGDKGIADLWIKLTNFFKCYNGIKLTGNINNKLQQDIFISDNCIDNCVIPIALNGNLKGNITNNWLSMGSYSRVTMRGIYIQNCNAEGGLNIVNNLIKTSDRASNINYGFRILNSKGFNISNNICLNILTPFHISGLSNSIVELIANNTIAESVDYLGIFEDCNHLSAKIGVTGSKPYNNGVHILSNCSFINIDLSAFPKECVTNTKLVIGKIPMANDSVLKVLNNNNIILSALDE